MGLWVDTDFGFDDLWALLQLRSYGIAVDGVSLVAGNAPLELVARNALDSRLAFDLQWPFYSGAATPLKREPITAQWVLGPRAMQTRGEHLPTAPEEKLAPFSPALQQWIEQSQEPCDILALGPLTNLAQLALDRPETFAMINRLTWMGGSSSGGNQTPHAEFNAYADPEAIDVVASTGINFAIVDMKICHAVSYGEADIPHDMKPPLADLMGGYLDIGLRRGREWMPIYDPLAALAITHPDAVTFEPRKLQVDTSTSETYGKTSFEPAETSSVTLATAVAPNAAELCVEALAMIRA